MDKTSLGDRMKNNYEVIFKHKLPERMPVIIRLDGKAFHSYTKGLEKPFCRKLNDVMDITATILCEQIQNVQIAYIQSDEISLLLHNYKKLYTQSWFNNEIQKMCSVSASIAGTVFTDYSDIIFGTNEWGIPIHKHAFFDARCFVLPESEVNNYFIWRQQDATRNSIQMLAQSLYSHKELHKKNTKDLQEMCFQKGHNWNDLETSLKRGRCAVKGTNMWIIDNEIPAFSQNKDYINNLLKVEEE